MKTVENIAQGLEAAAAVLRNGYPASAARMVAGLSRLLADLAFKKPDPIKAVLPRAIANVKFGKEGEGR